MRAWQRHLDGFSEEVGITHATLAKRLFLKIGHVRDLLCVVLVLQRTDPPVTYYVKFTQLLHL